MRHAKSILTVLGLSVIFGMAANANGFDGKWALDKKKSPGVAVAPQNLVQEIKQNGNAVTIKSKYEEPRNAVYPLLWVGIMTYELQLTSDGSEKLNHIGPFAHKSKTSVEGNRMVTDWSAAMDGGSVDGQWTRTLSDDGKEMTLIVQSKASDGRRLDQTLVFRKK